MAVNGSLPGGGENIHTRRVNDNMTGMIILSG